MLPIVIILTQYVTYCKYPLGYQLSQYDTKCPYTRCPNILHQLSLFCMIPYNLLPIVTILTPAVTIHMEAVTISPPGFIIRKIEIFVFQLSQSCMYVHCTAVTNVIQLVLSCHTLKNSCHNPDILCCRPISAVTFLICV